MPHRATRRWIAAIGSFAVYAIPLVGPHAAWFLGASLLQGYTGMIYGGADWIRDIHRGLAAELRRQGFSNISEAQENETHVGSILQSPVESS